MKNRLPSYPLMLIDPFFSLWSPADTLNEGDTAFWTGASKRAYGYVQADGVTYRFMGGRGGTALEQTEVTVSALKTTYAFACDAFDLTVDFLSPRDPRDPMLLSMPTALVDVHIAPKKKIKKLTTVIAFDENVCYDTYKDVTGCVLKAGKYRAATMGVKRQMLLSNSQDSVSADWGYVYLAGDDAHYLSASALNAFTDGGALSYADFSDERKFIAAEAQGERARFVAAFDDVASINYFGKILKTTYLTKKTVFDAITETFDRADELMSAERALDDELAARCGGRDAHYRLLCASLRQSVAAHKLVSDGDRLLFISKECHSNGCAATVDVTYPSAPLYLLYNPELLWGMLEPVFDFAAMPVWEFDFAPHDVGTYPLCIGQVYGLKNRKDRFACNHFSIGETEKGRFTHLPYYLYPAGNDVYDFDWQMPVEECSNMIILTCAAQRLAPKTLTAERLETLEKWAGYLVDKGLIPENQLCTDDFAGHLDKNANLSVKAVVGLGAYAALLEQLGDKKQATKYRSIAEDYAARWEKMCYDGRECSPLTMDGRGSYSLKYNLLFDKLLGLQLFSDSVYGAEVKAMLEHSNRYGAPLDERKTYTKSDWLLWMAALSDDESQRKQVYDALDRFLNESPSRVPFSDWYETEAGTMVHFQNRTVQGGIFAAVLADSKILLKK